MGWVGAVLEAVRCMVAATRAGGAEFISMFRYERRLFELVLGMVILNERPDAMTLIGVAIVIAAGLFTFIREARARRTSQAAVEPL